MLNFLTPANLIADFIILFICFPVHEFSHAFVADYFGDDTPRLAGRLTLNPLAHLDILGSIILIYAHFGWAKPVPINPFLLNMRSRWAEMWVSLAGPMSNLALAILAAIFLRLFQVITVPTLVLDIMRNIISINILLAIFNLIPISPLDGEKVLMPFLPPSVADFMNRIRPYSPLILMAIIFLLPNFGINIISWIVTPLMQLVLKGLGVN